MEDKKIKVGVVCICLNPPYWQYAQEMLWSLDTFFLKHPSIRDKYQTEFMIWSDIPEDDHTQAVKIAEFLASRGELQASVINATQVQFFGNEGQQAELNRILLGLQQLKERKVKVFTTESIEWPMPTLLRYNLFLQEEEYLKQFDYVFYIDLDMRITDWIGEEILGDGLTAAQHPMYALRRNLHPPYEPNPNSTAHIPRPGRIIEEAGQRKFEQLYYAGGFQGGKTEDWIKAMKVMKLRIEKDFNNNYVAIWNDESHWNRYLYEVPPSVVLNPSYIYPDSLIAEYYIKIWGRNYSPKIMTLTKKASTDAAGGAAVANQLRTM